MSTHVGPCVVCGKPTYCCDETHALGSGRASYCDPDWHEKDLPGEPIEFCSLACFEWLEQRMTERRKIAIEVAPTLFGLPETWQSLNYPDEATFIAMNP